MTNLVFHDEAPKTPHTVRRIDWAAIKEALKANPGKWAKVAENMSTSNVTQIRSGKNANFRGEELDDFAIISRRPKGADYQPGYSDLWGCYKPEASDAAPVEVTGRAVESEGA